MSDSADTYKVRTGWNMSLQDITVLDTARLDSEKLLVQMRYDARVASSFVDTIRIMRRVILPALEHEKTASTMHDPRDKFEALLSKVSVNADSEVLRSRNCFERSFNVLGASKELLSDCEALLDLIYSIKNSIGLGIPQITSRDMESAISRASA